MFLLFYKSFSKYNFVISLVICAIVLAFGTAVSGFNQAMKFSINSFSWIYISLGFLLSCFIFHTFHKREYFFYYNRNYSLKRLLFLTVLLNLLFFSILQFLMYKVLF